MSSVSSEPFFFFLLLLFLMVLLRTGFLPALWLIHIEGLFLLIALAFSFQFPLVPFVAVHCNSNCCPDLDADSGAATSPAIKVYSLKSSVFFPLDDDSG